MTPFDASRYPRDWKLVRERIIRRARNRCEFCGAPNGELIRRAENDPSWFRLLDGEESTALASGQPLSDLDSTREDFLKVRWSKPVKVVLTVAHLDHDPGNSDPENLKALCQRCHLRLDAGQHRSNAARTHERKSSAGMERLDL